MHDFTGRCEEDWCTRVAPVDTRTCCENDTRLAGGLAEGGATVQDDEGGGSKRPVI
jgi:hypothetical protein